MLSKRLAIDIGLDTNNDGELDSNDQNYVTNQVVGGVGGQISVPVFGFDEVHFPTDSGEELVYTNLEWLVLDIELPNQGSSLDGVIGSDLLTSGWFHAFFSPGQPDGFINQIYMDFRNFEVNGTGKIHLDLNSGAGGYVVIPPGPGILIRQSFRTTDVGEGADTDSYDIVLTGAPTDDVTITLSNVDGQVTAENEANGTDTLVFTPANWDQVQTVLVRAVDDVAAEGNHTGRVSHTVSSPDPGYDNRSVPDVIVRVTDDDLNLLEITSDQAGLNPISSVQAAESGGTVYYWVALSSAPTDEIWVLFEDTSAQSTAVKADSPEPGLENILQFSIGNWDRPQRIALQAVDDAVREGPHATRMVHTVLDITNFGDPIIGQSPLTVNIIDNDLGDVMITPSGGSTEISEAGATDTYDIALNMTPSGAVQIEVRADAQTLVSTDGVNFSATQQLSFTNTAAQTIHVMAIDDAVFEDTHTGLISHAVIGNVIDNKFPANLAINHVAATITDNDRVGLSISPQNPNETVAESTTETAPIVLAEGSGASTYWVSLQSQPSDQVKVFLRDSTDQVVAVDAANPTNSYLTFDAGNWNAPQAVEATAIDDAMPEGLHTAQIPHDAFGADPHYHGSVNLSTSIEDNDGVSIADAQVVEGHAGVTTLSFDVTLSAAQSTEVSVDVSVTDSSATALAVQRVAAGLTNPIFATAAPGQPDWLFIAEQGGEIKILDLPTGDITPFLTVSGLSSGGERGLLGLAFHPDYATNRLFYIYMTDVNQDTLVRRYQADPDGSAADPATATPVLAFDQPFGNHNGGWIGFGPNDGYLYIGSGDGGSGDDPLQNAQDITDNLLGKMLRIDVNGDDFPSDPIQNYAIPSSNPFVGQTGDDEIWAYGLRNPWRNSFDRLTGDLYMGDVGQGEREEINVQPAGSLGGENYGWRAREGTISNPNVSDPDPLGAIDPIYDYVHGAGPTQGFSVTGGYVYRGPIQELQGQYFFADYVRNRVWSLRFNGDAPASHDGTNYTDFVDWTSLLRPDAGTIQDISSFAEDAAGNLYILDHRGEVFRISQGADYLVHTETVMFPANSTSQTVEIEILGDRYPEENETLTATLSNVVNATIADGTAIGTIINDDAPQVIDVAINQNNSQRSIVDEVSLTFDSLVAIDESGGNAFEIINRDTSDVINYSNSVSTANGKTTVTFTFLAGPSVDTRGGQPASLADGNYQINAIASRIGIGGVALDGNGDRTGGDNYAYGDQAVDEFFRFFSDLDGDRDADTQDLIAFGQAFRSTNADPSYDPLLDFDGDGDIDTVELIEFGKRFRGRIDF